MKRFILKITIFSLLLVSVLFALISAIYIKSPVNVSNWFYGVNSKQKPRIILVGSSNVYTNYDYEKLNYSFENYDVIGAEMAATVGFIPLISNLELLKVTSEDIVVFCMPYQLYESSHFTNFYDELPQKVLSRKTILNAFKYNPKQAFRNFLAIKPKNYFRYITKGQTESKSADSLVKINKVQVNLLKNENYRSCQKSDDGNFNIVSNNFDQPYLENFIYDIKKNINTKVLFRFPAVHKDRNSINQEKVNFMSNNYDFINNFETTVYDSIYWYDQSYHLNRCGSVKNTNLFIEEIKIILNRK